MLEFLGGVAMGVGGMAMVRPEILVAVVSCEVVRGRARLIFKMALGLFDQPKLQLALLRCAL
jgi:hypothetical protein